MKRTLLVVLCALGVASAGSSGCGVVNALTEGESGSPFLQSNCSVQGLCDCFGVGCVCNDDALTCECFLDPDSGASCEVFDADETSCIGDECVCSSNGCACFGDDCECEGPACAPSDGG